MLPFIEQARFYAMYHQKTATRCTHLIGIPLVMLSMMILLGFVRVTVPGVLDVNLADIATIVLLIYYFRLNWRLALVLTPVLVFLLWMAEFFSYEGPTAFALWSFLAIFIAGIVFQLIGHLIEGKRPAFVDNAWQILVAPLFLVAEVFFKAGRMPELRDEIHSKVHGDSERESEL